MTDALIGCTGFVGTTLQKQRSFAGLYRSTNVAEIAEKEFDLVVCAAAPAQKWIANREPEADRRNIEALLSHLDKVRCRNFVLISTVDVFKTPHSVTEDTPVNETGLHAYGANRRLLEHFVEERFAEHLVVRLPGLVGPGLRKNVIFDFRNDNNVGAIDSRGVFQFYPMVNLVPDVLTALRAGLRLVHLTAEPISVAEIASAGFGLDFRNETQSAPAVYDFGSKHAALFGGSGAYQYDKRAVIMAVRSYAQSEPLTSKTEK